MAYPARDWLAAFHSTLVPLIADLTTKKMSDALIWELTKNGNAFLHKKGNKTSHHFAHQFTCEPGNLRNTNSFANSGLANSDAIHMDNEVFNESAGKTGEPISKVQFGKKSKSGNGFKTFFLRQGFRLSVAKIEAHTDGVHFRKDLKKAALARYAQLQRVCKVERGPEREGLKGAKRKLRRRS